MVQTLWEMTSACSLPSPKPCYCSGWVGRHPLGEDRIPLGRDGRLHRGRAGRLAPGWGQTRPRALRTRRCAPARPGPRASKLGARAPPRSSSPLDRRAPDAVLRRAQPRRRGPPELTLPLRAPPPPRRNPSRPPACLRASPRPLPPVPATARPWARRGRLRVRAAAVASSASEACDAAEPGSPSVHLREPRRRPHRRRRDER